MSVTTRLIGAIWLSTLIVIAAFAVFQVEAERRALITDLENRAVLVGEGRKEAVEPAVARGSTSGIERLLKKFGRPYRGIAVYDKFASPMVMTPDLALEPPAPLPEVSGAITSGEVAKGFKDIHGKRKFVYVTPIQGEDKPIGALAVFMDTAHLDAAEWELWQYNGIRFLVLALVISLITGVIVRITITRPMSKMATAAGRRAAAEFLEDPPAASRKEMLDGLGVAAEFLGVGMERVDYTKGLPERFRALQRFFERYPEYRERLVFVQLGAPSQTHIKRYRDLQLEVEQTLEAVNRAVGRRTWRPIVYLERHHERRDIWPFYRHADFCMVTALHDGMNLVAKEFVSVRDDDDGVLILSRFTGAARELRDALLVNPYDLDEMAEAIRAAVEMPAEERTLRMTRMRQVVREHNIYWAGLLLSELSRIPAEMAGAA